MASKAPKGTRGKRPPEPADSHAVIADWIDEAMPGLQPVVRKLDKLVRDNIGGSRVRRAEVVDQAGRGPARLEVAPVRQRGQQRRRRSALR